jgi:hypothetical protein
MYDFYCPYCNFGMNRKDINEQVHEDIQVGDWDIQCTSCNKEFELCAEVNIDYWANEKRKVKSGE